jgi:hypothetical protein
LPPNSIRKPRLWRRSKHASNRTSALLRTSDSGKLRLWRSAIGMVRHEIQDRTCGTGLVQTQPATSKLSKPETVRQLEFERPSPKAPPPFPLSGSRPPS